MHIPSQLPGEHFPVELPSMQPEAIASTCLDQQHNECEDEELLSTSLSVES
jgi:hypothetical protein